MSSRRMRHVAWQCDEITQLHLWIREPFCPFAIPTALIDPVQALVRCLLVNERTREVMAQLGGKQGSQVSDPMRTGVIACVDDMLIDVVAFEAVEDPRQLAEIGIIPLGGDRSFPALTIRERHLAVLDGCQECGGILHADLQQSFGRSRELESAVFTSVLHGGATADCTSSGQ
jgi:hypothetical protein